MIDNPKRDELLDILAKNGKITTELVVDTAKDPDNVLHTSFEWNDKVAGHQFRLEQAEHLINRYEIRIEVPAGSGEIRKVNVKMLSQNEDRSGWERTVDILADPVRADNLLNRMKAKAVRFRDEIDVYQTVADNFDPKWAVVSEAIEAALEDE